jgi:pimeloyl-ACP methyl ester carboxylesterase
MGDDRSSRAPAGRLVSFRATDGVALSGMFFEPRRRSTVAAAFLHGNGDSSIFRSARTNVLARELVRKGIAFLPFDNRGGGLLRWLKRSRDGETEYSMGGMSHELIGESGFDIDGALRFLRSSGYRSLHLIGHSTGANKIVLYHYGKPRNRVSSYVLLAPGDDTGLYYEALGEPRFRKALERSRREIERGRGDRFVPRSWSPFPLTFASFHDTIDPDGDYNIFPFLEASTDLRLARKPLFREFASITKRTLVMYGSDDEFCRGKVPMYVALLERHSAARSRLRTEIIEGADHGFHGRQEEVARNIASYIVDVAHA